MKMTLVKSLQDDVLFLFQRFIALVLMRYFVAFLIKGLLSPLPLPRHCPPPSTSPPTKLVCWALFVFQVYDKNILNDDSLDLEHVSP